MDYIKKFKGKDKKKIESFFKDLDSKILLSKKDKKRIIHDFEDFIDYYLEKKKSISSILKLLPLDAVSSGYGKTSDWYSLDTSSKIYPLAMREEWMSIYRLSYYLKEDINPIILRIALFFTMIRFPLFRTNIHKGFFWNYLDVTNRRFRVEEERYIPCGEINISKYKMPLFRVLYYKNRISCEFFHVLADAHGGSVFLTTLVGEYLRLLEKNVSYNDMCLEINTFNEEEVKDKFIKVKNSSNSKLIEKKALQLDGKKSVVKPCQIIHFDLDFKKIHDLAKSKDITVNELFLSFLFLVLSYSTSGDGDIKIQVPVNMRKYYETNTLRNFSLYSIISLNKKEITTLDSVILKVREESRKKINKHEMDGLMEKTVKLVKSISFIPLIIKRPIAKFIYSMFGDKSSTTVLSNLGRINLPSELSKEIMKGDFVLGTTLSNKALFSIITVGNILTFTISKFTTNSSIENNLYSLFKEYDLIINIHGSDKYEVK